MALSSDAFNPADHPHRRYNPLTGEHVLVSPQRAKRPWQGQQEAPPQDNLPEYDPECYLCPGNQRVGGATNPLYEQTYIFTNDFPALLPDVPDPNTSEQHPLLQVAPVHGTNRVMCFSPRHDLTLARMQPDEIVTVIDTWAEQLLELGAQYRWVQVFENRGAMMGSSNPHPHCQIWAQNSLPNIPAAEDQQQRAYFRRNGRPLLLDYARLELEQGERVVLQNADWLVVVPFWAIWPYETLLLPKFHTQHLTHLDTPEVQSLADILKRLLVRYDNLFNIAFPYSMGWHGAPFSKQDASHWQLHAHFLPPLLRSASVRKFMVGYELLNEAQRDLTAEQAAERLRGLSEQHYTLS